MKELYTAVGIFKLKNQGKNNVYPTVILSGKECRLDVQEMMKEFNIKLEEYKDIC